MARASQIRYQLEPLLQSGYLCFTIKFPSGLNTAFQVVMEPDTASLNRQHHRNAKRSGGECGPRDGRRLVLHINSDFDSDCKNLTARPY